MSLSKYYKKTDSFKPEELVPVSKEKKIKDPPSRWVETADNQFEREVFTVADLSDSPIPGEKKESTPETDEQHPPEPPLETMEQVEETEGVETEETINLENYIERTEMDKLLEKAFEDGVRNGLEKAEEDYGSATRSLFTICRQLDSIRETIIANSSRELQEFAIALAERIIRSPFIENRKTIIATLEEALERAIKSDEFTIFVSPDDYDIVMEKSEDLIEGLSGLSKIIIKKDSGIETGGARIESENCTIDATLASQFDMIREEMAKRL
ncbi:FliH/SctL family protein [Desulfomarina sp.]